MKISGAKPFVKWAGGKRWLTTNANFALPRVDGRYIEPFLGGGAIFFHASPKRGLLSDSNPRLIETYHAIQEDWRSVEAELKKYVRLHSSKFYYEERSRRRKRAHTRAAQFIYLNRTCFNGLYRENKKGQFNVPLGQKTSILKPDDDFEGVSKALMNIEIRCQDFGKSICSAGRDDFVFVDPPYTVAHNENGFIEYNQKIFSWDDQVRLKQCISEALGRGAVVFLTNANHHSIIDLYADIGTPFIIPRDSRISGKIKGRGKSTEVLYRFGLTD